MLDFPASPTVGATFTTPSGMVYTYDGAKWVPGTTAGTFLPIAGGTLTGPLTLAGTPKSLDAMVPPLNVALGGGSFVSVTMSANQVQPATGPVLSNFDTIEFDTNNEFNTSTHLFTAKRAGYYRVNALVFFSNATGGYYAGPIIYKNGAQYVYGEYVIPGASGNAYLAEATLHLAAGDTVGIYVSTVSPNGGTLTGNSPGLSKFQVQLLALG